MPPRTKNTLLLALGAVLGLILSLATGVLAQKEKPREILPWEDARLLAEVLERVRAEYVEPVEDSVLIESAVRGMVMDLDPHSQYLDCDEYAEVRISTSGNYSGVGLEVQVEGNQVEVITAIEGTPADVAGIESGDIIVAIDDTQITEANLSGAITLMRGKVGTQVRISVARPNYDGRLDFVLIRRNVQVSSVRHEMLDDDYGYIRISHFSDTTWRDTRKAVQKLQRKANPELRGILLDLRNNPGGVLDAAIDISDGFLDTGTIVTASGRGPDATFSHTAETGDILDGASIVVLVNGGSASSSEIIAGALQDNGRAMVVGTQTFGKGSVQTVMPLSTCRAIKLTTSRYFTPSGVSIQGAGITPDIEILENKTLDALANVSQHHKDSGERLASGDTQIREAMKVLKGDRVLQSKAQ